MFTWEQVNTNNSKYNFFDMEIVTLMFSCVFDTFPYGVLCQVWYLIVSISDLGLLPYFEYKVKAKYNGYKSS